MPNLQYLVVVFTNIRGAADIPAAHGASLLCYCRCVCGKGGVHQRGGGCMLKGGGVATSQECYDQNCLQIVDVSLQLYNSRRSDNRQRPQRIRIGDGYQQGQADSSVSHGRVVWALQDDLANRLSPAHFPSGPLLPPPPHPVQSHSYPCSIFWPSHLRVAFVFEKVLLSFPPPLAFCQPKPNMYTDARTHTGARSGEGQDWCCFSEN